MNFQGFDFEDIDINLMDYIFVNECESEKEAGMFVENEECEIVVEEDVLVDDELEEEEDMFIDDDDFDMFSVCSNGDLNALTSVITKDSSKVCLINNECVEVVCSENNLEMLTYILNIENIDQYYYLGDDDSAALRYSCYPISPDVVKYLLSLDLENGINPSDKNYEAFIRAYDFESENRIDHIPIEMICMHNSVINNDEDLFLAFINHPLFYPSDGSDLPEKVKNIVEKYNSKFFKSTKKPKGHYY